MQYYSQTRTNDSVFYVIHTLPREPSIQSKGKLMLFQYWLYTGVPIQEKTQYYSHTGAYTNTYACYAVRVLCREAILPLQIQLVSTCLPCYCG